MTGVTLRIAEHIATHRADDLPVAGIHASERSLLDAMGVMLAATTLGEGCAAFADIATTGARERSSRCTVLGRAERASPLQAALANGALAHAMDYEDALDGAPVHPNAAVIPVALALAEDRGDVTGRELVAAVALGCDLVCRMGLALRRNPDAFGWYPPPILSTFGAAAAAARLLKLDTEQTAHAFALALAQATFSSEFKTYPESSLRAVRDGFAAHAGLLAAMLAARGVSGHLKAFEGKAGFFAQFAGGEWNPEILTRDLGKKFHGEDVAFKPWPSCRGTHAFIEGALALRGKVGDIASIASIEAVGPPLLSMLVEPAAQKRAPATAIDAKFSLPFCIGAALADGEIAIPTFFDASRTRADVLAAARLVTFTPDPALGMKDAASGALIIRLKDGGVLERRIAGARGSPANPLTDTDLLAKFRDCARYAKKPLDAGAVSNLAARLLSASSASNAADLLAPLRS
jgi:2-methylcitrate dehydratase PrpD